MAALSRSGRPVDDVIADLGALRSGDVRREDGRVFAMIYDGGPGVHEAASRAAEMYLHESLPFTRIERPVFPLDDDVTWPPEDR